MHSVHSPRRHLLVAIAAPLLVFGCAPPDDGQANEPEPALNQPATASRPLPKPEAPLDREGLILAALRAATAAALGQDDSEVQGKLKGKRFELRMRFGCSGGDAKAASGWDYDEAKGVLRVRARADVDSAGLKSSDLLPGGYEGAVGFALRRPWMLTDGCPDPKFAPMAEGPAIAIVQLFTGSDSRAQRPEATYQTVAQVPKDELPASGLNLVVSGRLEPLADRRAIHCAAADGPPTCIVSTLIDRVAIEDPARAETLGEWGTG